jgi:hypothetical protein
MSTGKSGKHSSVPDASNIAAVSNVPVQVFEHFVGVQFRAVHAGQAFHVKKFCLLPSKFFLCTLDSTPKITDNELDLKISVLKGKGPKSTMTSMRRTDMNNTHFQFI